MPHFFPTFRLSRKVYGLFLPCAAFLLLFARPLQATPSVAESPKRGEMRNSLHKSTKCTLRSHASSKRCPPLRFLKCRRGRKGPTGPTGPTGPAGLTLPFLTASSSRYSSSTSSVADGHYLPFEIPFVADENFTFSSGALGDFLTVQLGGRYQFTVGYCGGLESEGVPTVDLEIIRERGAPTEIAIGYTDVALPTTPLILTTLDLDLLPGDQIALVNHSGQEIVALFTDVSGRSTLIEVHRIGN